MAHEIIAKNDIHICSFRERLDFYAHFFHNSELTQDIYY